MIFPVLGAAGRARLALGLEFPAVCPWFGLAGPRVRRLIEEQHLGRAL